MQQKSVTCKKIKVKSLQNINCGATRIRGQVGCT